MTELKLTPEQIAAMASDEPWLQITPEQHQFIAQCPAGQVVTLYDDTFMRVSKSRIEAVMEAAFKTAASGAIQKLSLPGGVYSEEIASIDCETPAFGQQFLRVHVTTVDGRKETDTAMIPDPRTT